MKQLIRQTFYRNMVLTLIPALLIVSLFIFYSIQTQKNAVLDTHMSNLAQFGNEIELLTSKLEDFALSMSNSKELANTESNTPEENIKIIQMYESSLPPEISLLYYFRHTRNIYYNNQILPYYSFEQSSYFDPALNYVGFFTELNKIGSAKLLAIDPHDRRNEHYSAVLISPTPTLSISPKGSVALLIPSTFFQQQCETYFGTDMPHLYVLDSSHNILYSSNSLMEQHELSQLIKSSTVGASEHSINGEDYIVLRTGSTRQTICLSLLPASFIRGVKSEDFTVVIGLCLFSLILSLLVAVLMTGNISKKASHIEAKQQRLHSDLANSHALINQLTLDRLLSGNNAPVGTNSQTYPIFKFNRFFVVIAPLGEQDASNQGFRNITTTFDSVHQDEFALYAVYRPANKQLVLIVNLHDQNYTQENILALIRSTLQEQLCCVPPLGCGGICDNTALIPNSFIEAQISLENANIAAKNDFCIFKDSSAQVHTDQYIDCASLERSIFSGNTDLAISIVHSNFCTIEQIPSFSIQRCLYFDIINSIAKIASAAKIPLQMKDLSKMSLLENSDALRLEIEHAILNLTQAVQAQQDQTHISSKRSLVEYVLANFTDSELSLGQLAEKFDLSYAYVSKTFKAETGQSFLSFVTQLRFAYIKEKLRTSDSAIKDIVLESGYMDVANFTRKFQQLEGVTPGQYRKIHKSRL